MAKCPSCKTVLKEDFGLITCPGCGTVCFVDGEDNVSVQSEEMANLEGYDLGEDEDLLANGLDAESDDNSFEESSEEEVEELEAITDMETEGLEGESEAYGLSTEENNSDYGTLTPEENYLETASAEEELEDHTIEEQPIEEEVLEDNLEMTEPLEGTEEESSIGGEDYANPLPDAPMSVEDFQNEIEIFGNLSSESFQSGAYFFDITISGIDTKDIRAEILETLDNSKLKLENEEFPKRIRDGVLKLHQIPAVKAFIIIQTLSHLKCELDWELKEVQDLESEPEVDESEYQEHNQQEAAEPAEDDFLGEDEPSEESEY